MWLATAARNYGGDSQVSHADRYARGEEFMEVVTALWDSWSDEIKKKWDPAMNLGDAGRKTIKGHDINYYLDILHETREHSLAEFRKRDDAWLQSGETEQFGDRKVNIHWKWFHVCEHESHHSGQIAFLAKRLPGAKPASEG